MPRPLSPIPIAALLCALAAPRLAEAGCPASAQDIQLAGQAVFAAYEARDLEGVHLHASDVRRSLDCLEDRLSPQAAAAAHVAIALSSFLNRDLATTEAAFKAARRADASVALPQGVPQGHPLQQAFDAADPSPGTAPTQPMGADPAYTLVVDGADRDARPTDAPAVVQAVQGQQARHSAYLLPESPLPAWAALQPTATTAAAQSTPAASAAATTLATNSAETSTETSAETSTETSAETSNKTSTKTAKQKRRGPSRALLATAGGMALVSGGLWAATVIDGQGYIDEKGDALDDTFDDLDELEARQEELDQHFIRVNLLGLAAQGSSALTGVLLVSAFVF